MSKPRKGQRNKPLSYEQALAELPAAQTALRAAVHDHSPEYQQCVEQLHGLYAVMARDAARHELARRRFNELAAVVDSGTPDNKRVIASCPSSDDLAQFGALDRGALASSVG